MCRCSVKGSAHSLTPFKFTIYWNYFQPNGNEVCELPWITRATFLKRVVVFFLKCHFAIFSVVLLVVAWVWRSACAWNKQQCWPEVIKGLSLLQRVFEDATEKSFLSILFHWWKSSHQWRLSAYKMQNPSIRAESYSHIGVAHLQVTHSHSSVIIMIFCDFYFQAVVILDCRQQDGFLNTCKLRYR